ncbi:DUF6734 family protein [uncultured Kordia sp.]|uniref:DUF6734 family protein n=1 Tax=uncultured Kordia sp. TaxID=507699 RepID=UPI00261AEBFB|nr:DUF6734 family protein [uncultured Kordia sp.]
MKIVHSYWSKPSLRSGNATAKYFGGWLMPKYYYYSWAYSCLRFREYYDEVELVTDKNGYHLLIEKLNLPYTNVRVVLDDLNEYSGKLWAIGKLHTYKLQEKPFIHADGDVFVWKRFEDELLSAPLISQNEELNFVQYQRGIEQLKTYFQHIPEIILEDIEQYEDTIAANAGIFGGNDVALFHEFVDIAFEFLDKNKGVVDHPEIHSSAFAIIYEQYLFSCLARKKNVEVQYLLKGEETDYNYMSAIQNKHKNVKYAHIIDIRKKLYSHVLELEQMFRNEYPEFYFQINRRLRSL